LNSSEGKERFVNLLNMRDWNYHHTD